MTDAEHPLVASVRRALRRPSPAAESYLALLQRRLGSLARLAQEGRDPAADLGLRSSDRALARRFLRSRHGSWTDGDENLVRGWLDRWEPAGTGLADRARAILEAADALAAIEARPQTLWFFLWELESMLAAVSVLESRRPSR